MLVNLAELTSQQLICPPDKRRYEFVDRGAPGVGGLGLYIEVRATSPGIGTFYIRWKQDNRTCHRKIGSTAVLSLADARREAKRLRAELTLGRDIQAEARAKKAVLTFQQLVEMHYWDYVKPRKRSWKRDVQLHRRAQAVFGAIRITDINRKDLERFHTDLAKEGLAPASCDLHLKYIKHVLALAVAWGMLETNPASRIPLYNPDNRVQNDLTDVQLDRLMGVLRSDENRSVCQIVIFLLATGLRLREALNARWSDLSRVNRTLTIPAAVSKSKRARTIPLGDAAMEVVDGLDTEGHFEYLFINKRTRLPYVTISKAWDRIRLKAGIPRFRLHDARHLMASLMINNGRSLPEIQHVLGHVDPRTSLRYARVNAKTAFDAANSVSASLMRETKPAA